MSEHETYDHSEAPIVWDGDISPTAEIIAMVRDDIRRELMDLSKPEDLVFHTVFLTDDLHGPIVTLFGGEAGGFVGVFSDHAEWKPAF